MTFSEAGVSGADEITGAFANYFESAYCKIASVIGSSVEECNISCNFFLNAVNEQDVLNTISKLKLKFTAGPDMIPSFLIRECVEAFVSPLVVIFNLCLKTNAFPAIWKTARVVPVFKKGDRSCIENYRPVSICSNFSKLFEFIISDNLSFHFKSYISESQHGFVRGRSTISNLCTFTQYVANSMDLGLQTDVIYTDFSKAFDRLDHEILVRKLETLGCSSNFVNFLYSYLSKQFVSVHGHRFNVFDCSSSVPQGSVLGPLLFNIFINDIIQDLPVSCLLYANDMKIFTSIREVGDCVRLQDNIDLISTWCIRNSLQLNIAKCVVMTLSNKKQKIEFDYNIDGAVLERPELVSDLGVLFDNKLSFTGHINSVIKNSWKTYGYIIRNTRDFSNISTLIHLFQSFVRSKLEYASIVWFPHHAVHIASIEHLQRRFLKYLCFREDGRYPPIGYSQTILLERFSFKSLSERNKLMNLLFLYKIVHNLIDCCSLLSQINFCLGKHSITTRSKNLFYLSTPISQCSIFPTLSVILLICSPVALKC
jgi:hypothetical protein